MSYKTMPTARRKSGGGALSALLGGWLGGGVEGGEFSAGENEIPAGVAGEDVVPASGPSVSRMKATSPIMDAIFNRGQNAALANQFNSNLALGQLDNYQALQRATAMQQLANQSAAEVARLQGTNQLNAIGATHDAAAMGGMPWGSRQQWTENVGGNMVNTASRESAVKNAFANSPTGQSLIEKNYAGQQLMPLADVMQKSRISAAPGELAIQPFTGDDYAGQTQIRGASRNQHVETVGGIKDPKTGQIIGGRPEVVSQETPGSVIQIQSPAILKAQYEAALKGEIPPVNKATPQASLFPTPKARQLQALMQDAQNPPNTAILPQLPQAYKDTLQDTFIDTPIDYYKQMLSPYYKKYILPFIQDYIDSGVQY